MMQKVDMIVNKHNGLHIRATATMIAKLQSMVQATRSLKKFTSFIMTAKHPLSV